MNGGSQRDLYTQSHLLNVYGHPHPHQHLSLSVFLIPAVLRGVNRYRIVVFACTSSRLMKLCTFLRRSWPFVHLWRSAHFKIGTFILLLLSFVFLKYILDRGPLSDIRFANISSHSELSFFLIIWLAA